MAYVALYRKYRSQSFGELIGQDAVTTVLQNSLRSGRISHAYLFYGARGCGKTSTARLLSRALNCAAQDSPTPEPCGACRICTAIRDGSCMDVVEIDAASETGVDNVREKIIENVQYVPTEARYKVYIIDEVHDLSAKAFDALLKTLEEPPPHVVFILATTEQHKVPITIRSRCTQFQFKRGTLAQLSNAIENVAAAEGRAADPQAVRAIARCAEGSWRDALSLLEQVFAFADGTISEEIVQNALGTVGTQTLERVVDTIARDSWAETLAIAGELVDSGKDVRQLLSSLNGYLRDLLVLASGATNTAAAELGADRSEQLAPQAKLFTPAQLLTMLGMLAAADRETRTSNQHRWLLERTLCLLMPSNLPTAAHAHSHSTAPARQAPTPAARPPVMAEAPAKPPSAPLKVAAAETVAELEPSGGATRFAGDVTLEVVLRAWQRILKCIEQSSPAAAMYLQKAEVVGLEHKVIALAFSDTFARDRIMNKGKVLVEKKINEVLQSEAYRIRLVHDDGNGVSAPSTASNGKLAPPGLDLHNDDGGMTGTNSGPAQPSILEASLEIFGGEVIRSVQQPQEKSGEQADRQQPDKPDEQ